MKRILVIGMQEATRDLIDPWIEQGLLPNIAALIERGACGHVRAQAPLITPHSWANILTGLNAGQHGIFDYWQRGADGVFREVTSTSLQAPPMWERLRDTGLRSTFVNLPLTWPLPELDGVVVAERRGNVSTREIFAQQDLYDRLVATHGDYRPEATAPGGRRKQDYLDLFDTETVRISEAFEFLLNVKDWDFAMVYFIDAAMAQHYFWADMAAGDDSPYSGIITSAYQNLDAAIGHLVRSAGEDTVIFVMSECGAGPLLSGINLNNWLAQLGLFHDRRGLSTSIKLFAEYNFLPLAKQILPAAVKAGLSRCSPTLKNWASSSGTQLDVNWSRTKAFSRGKEGNIFINLAGRDPHGVVQPGSEYDELLNFVADALYRLKDPGTGKLVVTSVNRPEQLYSGPAIEFAPDLIVDWSNAAYMTTESARDKNDIFVERWRKGMSWPTTGSHRYDGVLIVAGPDIPTGIQINDVSHFDLLPTWLTILNQPVPPELNGRIVPEIIGS